MNDKRVIINKVLNGYIIEYSCGDIREVGEKDDCAEVYTSLYELEKALQDFFEPRYDLDEI